MEKKYIVSKYSHYCEDETGNLLLCNFYTGLDSLAAIDKTDVEEFNKLILNNKNIAVDETNEPIINQLCSKGFLVDVNVDEDMLYDAQFYNQTYRNKMMLTILPTHKCNFKCKYCYEKADFVAKGEMSHESQINLLRYIQKNAGDYPKLRVAWFGGEPLSAVQTVEYLSNNILKICESKKIAYESEMTTNGYNLTPEIFDMLYSNKVYSYQITIDGVKEQHDKQRVKLDGSGTFDRIFSNLLYIKNNKKYKLANITVRTNATKDIVNNIDEFIELYNNHFESDDRFTLRFTQANMYNSDSGLSEDEYVKRNTMTDFIYNNPKYEENIVKISELTNIFRPIPFLCYAARKNEYIIDAELNVYKCSVHFDYSENKIGYINTKGDMILDECLHKKWYVKSKLSEKCRSCFFLPRCNRGGCPYSYNFKTNSLENNCHIPNLEKMVNQSMVRLTKHRQFAKINF